MIFFYLLIATMPLYQHPLWTTVVGDVPNLTLFKVLGGVCVLYALFHLLVCESSPEYLSTWPVRLFLLFYAVVLLSALTQGPSVPLAYSPASMYTSFLLMLFVTLTVVDTLRRLRAVLVVVVGSIGFASLYVLREWQRGYRINPAYRPGYITGDSNYFAISVVLCLPLAVHLFLVARAWPWKLFWLGCAVLALSALTLGASRGGLLGIAGGLLFLIWRSERRLRSLAITATLAVPLITLLPNSPVQRFLHPTMSDDFGVDARLVAWNAGLRMFRENPVFGIGLGNFRPRMAVYRAADDLEIVSLAHNAYLEIAAEMGLVGLVAFVTLLGATFVTFEHARLLAVRSRTPLLQQAALGLQAGLAGCCVSVFFLTAQYQKLFWLVIFLAPCLLSLARQAEARQSESATEEDVDALALSEPEVT